MSSKFNAEARARLLKAFRSGTNQRQLATRFKVDQATISRQIELAIKERLAIQAKANGD